MAKKVKYTQPLLGEANAAGDLRLVPGAVVQILQDGAAVTVYSDEDGTEIDTPALPSGVASGTAGVSTRGELTVWLEPGSGYSGVATVGQVATTFPLPDISPDVVDVQAPIPSGTLAETANNLSDLTDAAAARTNIAAAGAVETSEAIDDALAATAAVAADVDGLVINSIRVPASNMEAASTGTPPTKTSALGVPVVSMTEAVTLTGTAIEYPPDWATYHVDLIWTNLSAAAGDVTWRFDRVGFNGSEGLNAQVTAEVDVTAAAPAQNVSKVSRIASDVAVGTKAYRFVRVHRRGGGAGEAADTLAGAVGIIEIALTRAT